MRLTIEFQAEVSILDKSFHVDDNCTSCGVCERVCPVKNIVLIDGVPQWQHKCQHCLARINFCPEKSIQFGDKTL
ncbi:MAG: EFR1 family ferrodoxin [Candidatus Lokiarchaeota archaeon]|nr:EFR1 family ferrodoxin [Candidatus Lokiarchaeota archaeon]